MIMTDKKIYTFNEYKNKKISQIEMNSTDKTQPEIFFNVKKWVYPHGAKFKKWEYTQGIKLKKWVYPRGNQA